ncbi:adenosylcobinamide-phosphate synthase CbiB [Alicyclobacillus dauci]|uniref:Cobalamin biosynthesis protein CobD n=1 Tax=Alicyclobacillus dauci TaxID=1475485 RepID=A0ABY6Z0N5_9BACL|nr:adenosylcobinamide-phosphate synthase CbiB [Alicyclobacillus dauci]WAH36148.1 adenosylcobinamide-phosphate synthase CbiB [Alicyclobacillus dauci]
MINFGIAAVALMLDRLIGDPRVIPHPVILFGKWIALLDRHLNRSTFGPLRKRIYGVVLTVTTLFLAYFIPWLGLGWLHRHNEWLWVAVNVFLVSTTIAWKGLMDAGRAVLVQLQVGGIEAVRSEVGKIVGRDTQHLSEEEVARATVETLAENIVDAIISPVFFACIGGTPLALLYRAANTLDSMVGYKNERYREFGWCSARVDDVLNYIPARITILLLVLVLWITKQDPRRAYRTMRQDARKHPSPNSGIPESMMAGGLGVMLGGLNYYGGIPSFRATMGEPLQPLSDRQMIRAIRVVNVLGVVLIVILVVLFLVSESLAY